MKAQTHKSQEAAASPDHFTVKKAKGAGREVFLLNKSQAFLAAEPGLDRVDCSAPLMLLLVFCCCLLTWWVVAVKEEEREKPQKQDTKKLWEFPWQSRGSDHEEG